jgi:Lipid A 3-O-deacylase (PagL)
VTPFIAILFAPLFFAATSRAQAGPQQGEHEWQVWTGGGHGINGSQQDDGVFNVGARFGLILTAPHGPGFLKGRLEYALDVIPLFCVTQANGTACGGGVDPFAFKWILSTPRNVAPYFEIGGGTLFTNIKTPPNTSQINFTTGGALGLHFLQSKHNLSAEIRFMHISNAGLSTPNPGINTLQLRIGFGWFSQKQ